MNRTITFTPRELEMIMTALDTHTATLMRENQATPRSIADEINEFNELRDDLLAESSGHHDDWGDRAADAIPDAATQFINAGIVAREMKKVMAQPFADSDLRTGSLAAQRRVARMQVERMMQGTATPVVVEEDD